jgi:glycosyltransferase involved in cell wall biosynthesis
MYDDPIQFVFNKGTHQYLGLKVLNTLLNSADGGLITLHPNFNRRYKFQKVYLTNGSPSDRILPKWQRNNKYNHSNDEEGISAVWVGKTDLEDGMRILIDSLDQTDVRVNVNVFGFPYKRSKAYAQKMSVDDAIHFHGNVCHDKLVSHLYESDVGLCILPRREDWLYSYPIKIGEYMSAGIIPVVSDFPGINRMVGSVGYKINPVPKELSMTFERISRLDAEKRRELQQNSRNRAETISWQEIRNEMAVGLEKLLSSQSEP